MNKKIILSLALILWSLILVSSDETEPALTWPREIETTNVVVTLYQPQLETFRNDVLTGRMAISIKPKEKDLIFGAIWFSAKLITDLDSRTVLLEKMNITQTHFPEVDPEKVEQFKNTLEKEIEDKNVDMSLDRLLASLDLAEINREMSTRINNDSPDIYFRTEPAMLIIIDGDPIMQKTDEDEIEAVVNTPYFIVKDTKTGKYYIKGAKWWYESDNINGSWEVISKPPKKIRKLADQAIDDEGIKEDSVIMSMDTPPEIIITTKPSELIQTDGNPDYGTIDGTQLLYVKNSESDILMNIDSQEHYLVLAGRWYTSRSLTDGSWKFTEPEDLPEDFTNIPTESDIGNVRTSVPGTDEANMALLEQTIPQTATIDRETATIDVQYDGDPSFESIEGTNMSYAVNTDKQVLLIDGIFYCVDNGIWFESKSAKGPWSVSTDRPDEVDNLPPENPNYNVKYVYIYDSTPEVVYVGYLPGYTCSYVYGGVVVYGTGYYYNPWYHHYYYPRPVTWGFGVHYNPWTGWGFSFGVSYGWLSVSFGRSYWGPGGYRHGYRHGYRRGYHHGYRHGYNRGYSQGARAGYRAGQRSSASNNVYRNRSNGVRSTGVNQRQAAAARSQGGNVNRAQTGSVNRGQSGNVSNRPATSNQNTPQTRPSTKDNNVYSDRNGNIQRRDQNGTWEQRSNSQGSWDRSSSGSNTRDSQQMNREHNSRQQGSQRQQNYNSSSYNRSQSGGASHGGSRSSGSRGGGRRR